MSFARRYSIKSIETIVLKGRINKVYLIQKIKRNDGKFAELKFKQALNLVSDVLKN